MAKKSTQDPAPLALRSMATLAPLPGGLLGTWEETQEQADILQQARTDFLRQRVAHGRFTLGQQVLSAAVSSTQKNWVDYVEGEQALLSRVQNPAVRQRLVPFLERLAEDHANGLLETRQILEDQVKGILSSPIDPPAARAEEYEVEVPNLWKQLVGGTATVKRVRR